jgi:hypothetical protein
VLKGECAVRDKYEDVPESIREAFAGRPYLSAPKTAKALAIGKRTLRAHTEAGDIQCRFIGTGLIRARRIYTLADVADFLRVISGKRQANIVRIRPESLPIYGTRVRSKRRRF